MKRIYCPPTWKGIVLCRFAQLRRSKSEKLLYAVEQEMLRLANFVDEVSKSSATARKRGSRRSDPRCEATDDLPGLLG
jgi:hypothetical protein